MRLNIKVTNAEIVRQGLEALSDELPKIGRQRIRTRLEAVKRRMQEYPPERTGQSVKVSHPVVGYYIKAKGYKRTGRLGASWAIEKTAAGYELSNSASRRGRAYAKYVVGDAYGTSQAWMHRGRWQVFRTVVEEELAKLPREIDDNISMVARRRGL